MMLFSLPPLRIARLLLELRPVGPLHFPLEERGNALRGAFGTVFQRSVCDQDCTGTRTCAKREFCEYARIFEPRWGDGPKLGSEAPRPFVFRPPLSSDAEFGPHRPILFEVRLFGEAVSAAEQFIRAFQTLEYTGLYGQSVCLESVNFLDWMGISHGSPVRSGSIANSPPPLQLVLDEPCSTSAPSSSEITLDFSTPTLLKHGKRVLRVPTFAGLINRVADRISDLCELYEKFEWQADFKLIAAAAASTTTVDWEGRWVEVPRTSTHTGQQMPMAGFKGTVVFDGVDPQLWPLLLIGQEIHAGSHAVWGHGWYRVRAG